MLSEDIARIAHRLEVAGRLGQALSPVECITLARALSIAAEDTAAIERTPLALGESAPPRRQVHALCVTEPPPDGETAQIIPFPGRGPEGR